MNHRHLALAASFAITIFSSAFLLFQVQPLIGKYILPWFGGTPAVWTTCMLFFQVILFAGYAYAHLVTRMRTRWQAAVHLGLLWAAIMMLPISPGLGWKPNGTEEPISRIIMMLACSVGLPYFVLSATGPLLQSWFAISLPGRSPYRLYALSNVGSLLALVSYPFVVEPAIATSHQAQLWSGGFIAFAVACTCCAIAAVRFGAGDAMHQHVDFDASSGETSLPAIGPPPQKDPDWTDRMLWFGLAMVASVMLLATTNQVCMDVAAVPFLWLLPLTLYLMTFILCFDSQRWYSRRPFAWALAASTVAITTVMLHGSHVSLMIQVVVYFAGLFFCCMVCHGELAKMKPHPRHLTAFYLTLAAGGAAGGLFVGVMAPLLFPLYWELHMAIVASIVLALIVYYRDTQWLLRRGRPAMTWSLIGLSLAWLCLLLTKDAKATIDDSKEVSRNFYGVLRVFESSGDDPDQHQRTLAHGRIVHGLQFLSPSKRRLPTTYYHANSGIGRIVRAQQEHGPISVGVVGLGVGTLAAYGRAVDSFCFYEINADVIRMADEHFTYLRDTPSQTEIVLGDARLSLEREASRAFDLLVIDAFSGDAIPTHLLTTEAMEVYLRHLAAYGVVAIHYSNLHFDLEPVIHGLAESFSLQAVRIKMPQQLNDGSRPSHWALLSRNDSRFADPRLTDVATPFQPTVIVWTDDHCNLFEILK